MPRDITLPNGQVVTDVPDDMNKFAFMEYAINKRLATPEDFGQESADATEGMGGLEKFRAGMGRGAYNVGRNIGNVVGAISDEEMEDAAALDEDLMATGAGMAGSLVGEVAATLPAGGVLGAAAKGASAIPGLARGGQVLTRTLANPVGRGAVEGAAVTSLLSEDRGQGAAVGGGLGAGFGALGKIVSGMVRNFRVTPNITDAARRTQEATGHFIPLSQALPEGSLSKNVYEGIIANLPGGGAGRLRGQHRAALEDVRNFIATKAHPDTADLDLLPDDDLFAMMGKLDDYWRTAYDDIGQEAVDTGLLTLDSSVLKALDDVNYPMPAPGRGTVSELLDMKNALNEMLGEVGASSVLRQGVTRPIKKGIDDIDTIIRQSLPEEMVEQFDALGPAYKNYMDLVTTMQGAASQAGEFGMSGLVGTTMRRGGREALSGGTPLQQTAIDAMKALPDFPSKQGIFQIAAGLGLASSFFPTTLPLGATTAGVLAAGRFLARPGVQKLLSGQHNMGAKLDAYKEALQLAGYSGRQIASIVAGGRN